MGEILSMDILQLSYFCKLAERQHLAQTAQELHISPPSLSAMIKKLEDELGCRLFDREGRSILLNENGKEFYESVSTALQLLRNAETTMKARSSAVTLRVAVENVSQWREVVSRFEALGRNIQVELFIHSNPKRDGFTGMDFFLGNEDYVPPQGFSQIVLFSPQKYYLVVGKDHRLSGLTSVDAGELGNEVFAELWHYYTSEKRFSNPIFEQVNIQPKCIFCDYFSRLTAVRKGACVAISTKLGAKFTLPEEDGLRMIELTGIDGLTPKRQVIAWNEKVWNTGPRRVFVDEVQRICAEINRTLEGTPETLHP